MASEPHRSGAVVLAMNQSAGARFNGKWLDKELWNHRNIAGEARTTIQQKAEGTGRRGRQYNNIIDGRSVMFRHLYIDLLYLPPRQGRRIYL
jgi:hypothetical protein